MQDIPQLHRVEIEKCNIIYILQQNLDTSCVFTMFLNLGFLQCEDLIVFTNHTRYL